MKRFWFVLRAITLLPLAALLYGACLVIKVTLFCVGDGWPEVWVAGNGKPTERMW